MLYSSSVDYSYFFVYFLLIHFFVAGLGLFTSQPFQKGSFLVTYPGELITAKEGELREAKGESGFRYFFRYGEKKWW